MQRCYSEKRGDLMNTEKFIKKWEKVRQIGKKKYILKWSMIYCICFIICMFSSWLLGNDFNFRLYDLFLFFIFYVIIFYISIQSWNEKEKKYNKLLKLLFDETN